ncbi:DMT family transporter [Algivirga pacifica]|uniref:DMT family transporter n=1 Tax=Algivirga pacifica TaxID=1162670 RepID=A0ABP9DBY0_9BACT
MNYKPTNHLLELNLAVLFISTSGTLGRYIDLPAPTVIALRALLAGILLFAFCKWKGISLHIQKKHRGKVLLGGFLLGLHWVTYFYSLQLSNVAIGMLSLFTYPAITALLEPLFMRTRMSWFHIFLSMAVLMGIYLLAPDFGTDQNTLLAIAIGVFSAFCYALRNILLKKVEGYHGSSIMTYQLLIITVLLLPSYGMTTSTALWDYLPATAVLALLTTSIGHTLFVYSLKGFSAATASIISCMGPVYGIILGIIFLGEVPAWTTVAGGTIILIAAIAESLKVYHLPKYKVVGKK